MSENVLNHAIRHRELHTALDDVVAHFLLSNEGKRPAETTILELIMWSGKQIDIPDHIHEVEKPRSLLRTMFGG